MVRKAFQYRLGSASSGVSDAADVETHAAANFVSMVQGSCFQASCIQMERSTSLPLASARVHNWVRLRH